MRFFLSDARLGRGGLVFREQLLLNTLLPGLAWRLYALIEALPPTLTILD